MTGIHIWELICSRGARTFQIILELITGINVFVATALRATILGCL